MEDGTMIRPRTLWAMLGVSAATGWRLVKRGDLPAPMRLSPGAVAWRRAEIETWLASRPRTNSCADGGQGEGAAA